MPDPTESTAAPAHADALRARRDGRRLAIWTAALALLLVLAVGGMSLVGEYHLTWGIWQMRLTRLAAAAVVGAALAVAGVALQSLLRNPLASPFVLGISSGSGVGVLLGMLLGQSVGYAWASTPLLAAVGAMLTMALVYLIAQRRGRLDPFTLLLTGVIVNAFNGAIMLFLYLYIGPRLLADYLRWSMGSIPEAPSLPLLGSTAAISLAGWGYLFLQAQAFNVQALGDDVARSSGVNVAALRLATFAVASLMTAAAVALAGPVGFVGLIIPHVCRMALGPDHRLLTVAAGFVGAAFLVLADTFCRSTVLLFGRELPVGILTAFCGGPFFIYLLRRRLAGGVA